MYVIFRHCISTDLRKIILQKWNQLIKFLFERPYFFDESSSWIVAGLLTTRSKFSICFCSCFCSCSWSSYSCSSYPLVILLILLLFLLSVLLLLLLLLFHVLFMSRVHGCWWGHDARMINVMLYEKFLNMPGLNAISRRNFRYMSVKDLTKEKRFENRW